MCVDAEGVNIGRHEIADGLVNETMALQRAQARETVRSDADMKVTAAVFRTFVTDVLVAFVDDLERGRLQCSFDTSPDFCDSGLVHGRTSLNGFTVTLA